VRLVGIFEKLFPQLDLFPSSGERARRNPLICVKQKQSLCLWILKSATVPDNV